MDPTPFIAAIFGAIIAVANYHYWFVLTPEERATPETDFDSWP